MIEGIDRIIDIYGRVIVLEDDIITAPGFLHFMNRALEYYENDKEIFSICGYNPVVRESKLQGDTFTFDAFRSWGWAIWKDRWKSFCWEEDLVDQIDACRVHSECPLYATAYREDLIYPKGTYERYLDLKLFYNQLATNRTVIYSKQSLCDNIGMNGQGLTIARSVDYHNENFKGDYIQMEYNFSKEKLTIDSDEEYFYEFRQKEFVLDLFFEQHFNRERLYMNLYYALSQMLLKKIDLKIFFEKIKKDKIVIYGWGIAGKLLYDMLKEKSIKVECIIDRRDLSMETGIKTYTSFNENIQCDVVVVTAIRDFLAIEQMLRKSNVKNIYSMDDMIFECLRLAENMQH